MYFILKITFWPSQITVSPNSQMCECSFMDINHCCWTCQLFLFHGMSGLSTTMVVQLLFCCYIDKSFTSDTTFIHVPAVIRKVDSSCLEIGQVILLSHGTVIVVIFVINSKEDDSDVETPFYLSLGQKTGCSTSRRSPWDSCWWLEITSQEVSVAPVYGICHDLPRSLD